MIEDFAVQKKNPVELQEISFGELRKNINDIINCGIPLFRKNNEGKIVTIPPDKLQNYIKEIPDSIIFYLEKNWEKKIKDTVSYPKAPPADKEPKVDNESPMMRIQKFGAAFERIEQFKNLSIVEREEILDQSIEILHELKAITAPLGIDSVVKMVEVIANTYYTNYANLDDTLSSENVKDNITGIFSKTEWIIKLIADLFKRGRYTYNDYKVIDAIKTGSVTIDSMCKGVLWFVAFSLYYNDYIEKGLVAKNIRTTFKERYQRYYKRQMRDVDITIETIIQGGLRRIETDKEMIQYSTGALLYDIGKIPFITYHDGDEPYDENMLKVHVLTGYNMILKGKNYSFPVYAMTAFHHEYYGNQGSYKFTNPILSKLSGVKRTDGNAKNFITYDEKAFIAGTAIAYFPCKVIEIIDIYNALITKKNMPHFETLSFIKKNFIAVNLKIDPILFEIFVEFMQSCGLIEMNEREKLDSIIY